LSLVDYARTDRQREIIEVWELAGKNSARAANELGINPGSVRDHVCAVRAVASAAGYSENWDARRHVPEGEYVVGRSILTTNEEGERAWLKTRRTVQQAEKNEAFNAMVDQLNKGIIPVKRKAKGKAVRKDDLMPSVIIGDAHIGALAFRKETGDRDFNVGKATCEVDEAICALVEQMPEAKNGLLISVGDLAHSDRGNPASTTKGTLVDMSCSYEDQLRACAQVLMNGVEQMLNKVDNVTLVVARGNHDDHTSLAVQVILETYFAKEPRVNVLKSSQYVHYVRWHKWLLGIHHGDKIKAAKLAQVMPRDMPKDWGETTHRQFIVGHFHHQSVQEFEGVTVSKHGCLAPPDRWHSSMGYNSAHTMDLIVYKAGGGKLMTCTYEIPREYDQANVVI
jgi:UDP-2,3-diacylglucosamine pyrophosphatase LpxH